MKDFKLLILYIVTTILMNSGCGPPTKKMFQKRDSYYSRYFETIRNDSNYITVRNCFPDTFNRWVEMGLEPVQYFKVHNPVWILDSFVVFNRERDKALIFMLIQDSRPYWKFDYVKTIRCEKIDNKWHFYYIGGLLIHCKRAEEQTTPYSKERLSESVRKSMYFKGYLPCLCWYCWIEYDFLEIWMSDDRTRMHQEFLNNKTPVNPFEEPFIRPR